MKLLLMSLILVIVTSALVYAGCFPVVIQQPDGKVITCVQCCDHGICTITSCS